MARKANQRIKNINNSVKRQAVILRDTLGPFTEAFGVVVVGVIFLVVAFILGIGSPSDWASFFASFMVAAITIFFIRRSTYRHSMLIEVTMSYLVEGGKPFLDHLLGKLISGTWHGEDFKPGNALFKVVEEICLGQDWEMKRRIVEALPALSEIDEKRSLSAIGILRDDWEPIKWKSDLRRRAIEALVIAPARNHTPLIYRAKPAIITSLLKLREKDQVYTVFATLEALHDWEELQPKLVGELQTDALAFSSKTYTREEKNAIKELANLLSIAKNSNAAILAEKITKMLASKNHLIRIAAGRNIIRLSDRFPDKTLDLIAKCLESDQHVNVRRPMARERPVDLVIRMLNKPLFRSKAESILFKLISDPDDLVRIPTFDKIETIVDQDKQLALKMCDFILANDKSQVMLERANHIKLSLTNNY